MDSPNVFVKLAQVLNVPRSRYVPRILERLITVEQGEILLQLPASASGLGAKLQKEEKAIVRELDDLTKKGLAIPRTKGNETTYYFVRSALQFHDSCGVYEPALGDVGDLWRQWRETEFYELCREWERMPVPIMRVFPYPQAVHDKAGMLPHENFEAVASAARQIAAVKCVCRLLLDRCQRPLEVCITFDAAADFAIRRGIGRRIDLKEAQQIFQVCASEGLVPSNLNGARVTAMCFCCPDCCIFLQPQRQYGYRLFSPSRFEAGVDAELCDGCQRCVEVCQFDAVEMEKPGASRKLAAVVQPEKCYGCGVCVVGCPTKALTLKLARPPEHIPELGPRY